MRTQAIEKKLRCYFGGPGKPEAPPPPPAPPGKAEAAKVVSSKRLNAPTRRGRASTILGGALAGAGQERTGRKTLLGG